MPTERQRHSRPIEFAELAEIALRVCVIYRTFHVSAIIIIATSSTRNRSATCMRPDHVPFLAHDQGVQLLKPKVQHHNGLEAGPEGRGQTTPKYALPCASWTSILSQVSIGHRKSTGGPQPIPQFTHIQHPHACTTFIKATVQHRPHHS